MNHYWVLAVATAGILLLFFGLIVLGLGVVTPLLVRRNILGLRASIGDRVGVVPGARSHPWIEAGLSGVVVTLVGLGMVFAGIALVPTM